MVPVGYPWLLWNPYGPPRTPMVPMGPSWPMWDPHRPQQLPPQSCRPLMALQDSHAPGPASPTMTPAVGQPHAHGCLHPHTVPVPTSPSRAAQSSLLCGCHSNWGRRARPELSTAQGKGSQPHQDPQGWGSISGVPRAASMGCWGLHPWGIGGCIYRVLGAVSMGCCGCITECWGLHLEGTEGLHPWGAGWASPLGCWGLHPWGAGVFSLGPSGLSSPG